jgi:hypothetical protein
MEDRPLMAWFKFEVSFRKVRKERVEKGTNIYYEIDFIKSNFSPYKTRLLLEIGLLRLLGICNYLVPAA